MDDKEISRLDLSADGLINLIDSNAPGKVQLPWLLDKGYGILPKIVMIDPDLTLEAKSMLAFLYSFTGSGNSECYPSQDYMRNCLNIGISRYYKHFEFLRNSQYFILEQKPIEKSERNHSVNLWRYLYILNEHPEKFNMHRADRKLIAEYDKISAGSVFSAGYGIIPKRVLLDTSLEIEEKAIYAYLCVHSPGLDLAIDSQFTSDDDISHTLYIGKNRLYRNMKNLCSSPYVTKMRDMNDGKFARRSFVLLSGRNDNETNSANEGSLIIPLPQNSSTEPLPQNSSTEPLPQNSSTKPLPQNSSTKEVLEIGHFPPLPQNPYTENPSTENPSTENPSTENPTTNNTFVNNTFTNNTFCKQDSSSSSSALTREEDYPADTKSYYVKEIRPILMKTRGIPADLLQNKAAVRAIIYEATSYDYFSRPESYHSNGDLYSSRFKFACSCFEQMLLSPATSIKLGVDLVSKDELLAAVNRNITVDVSIDYIDLNMQYIADARDRYVEAEEETRILSPKAYMRTVLWDCLFSPDLTVPEW